MSGARRYALLPLLSLLAAPGTLCAQGAALSGVRGTVTSAEGSPLELVRIEIIDDATGRSTAGVTDPDGRYTLTNLLSGGPHTLTVSALGHAGRRIDDVYLQPGTVHRFDFVLEASALPLPQVEVRAEADPRFATGRTGAATVVSRAEVTAHPTIERNVLELAALSPLAARAAGGTTIAGQNARFNALQIDGGRYQDMFGASADGAPGGLAHARPLPLDAVDQFQVLVAPFDVRHSGFTGGLLNVVTRGGTNRWEAGGFAHYRDSRFLGDLDAQAQSSSARGFRNALAGISLGGPLVRNRAHVFVAFELERRTTPSSGYNLGSADALAARIAPDSAARLAGILRDQFGLDAGSAGQISLDNPRENLFVRADWQTGRHRLMLRHNHAGARRDVEPNRAAVGTYDFASQVFTYGSTSRATSLQLVSTIGRRWSNELLVSRHRITDRTTPASTAPAIEVDVVSRFDTLFVQRRLRAGGRMDAQANRVTQSSLELRNALTGAFGTHLLTFGGSAELLRMNSLYTPNPHGLYYFRDLAALEANRPDRFERTLTLAGRDPAARFDVGHVSVFAQDEWSPLDRLTLHMGLRVDLPLLRDRPEENEALREALGASTATLPRTGAMWSPRVAFNWQSNRRLRTQLRGGVGLFTGRPAYAWLADAYTRTGLTTGLLSCDTTAAPPLDPARAPTACAGQAAGAGTRTAPVTLFDRNFRFPQDLRIVGGMDQTLPFGFVASADFVLGRARRQIALRDINLGPAIEDPRHEDGYTDGFGFERRTSFGTPTLSGFETVRHADGFHQVIQLGDDAHNRALAVSVELAGRIVGTTVRGAYTFTRSLDVQSLTHREAAANFGAVPTADHPNRPAAALSDFDRPHRVLLSLSRRFRQTRGTQLSLLYVGESGAPFTYVYAFDVNGDAVPGPGLTESFNDPIHVTELLSQFPGSIASALAFAGMLDADPCLAAWRGATVTRNSCRGPATHRLDLRATHTVRLRGTDLHFVADLLNVLHLIGSDHGRVQTVPSLVPLLGVHSPRTPEPLSNAPGPLQAWYAAPVSRDSDGRPRSLLPYTLDPAASRWQAQIGIEIRR